MGLTSAYLGSELGTIRARKKVISEFGHFVASSGPLWHSVLMRQKWRTKKLAPHIGRYPKRPDIIACALGKGYAGCSEIVRYNSNITSFVLHFGSFVAQFRGRFEEAGVQLQSMIKYDF
jgi:hypothetical protein